MDYRTCSQPRLSTPISWTSTFFLMQQDLRLSSCLTVVNRQSQEMSKVYFHVHHIVLKCTTRVVLGMLEMAGRGVSSVCLWMDALSFSRILHHWQLRKIKRGPESTISAWRWGIDSSQERYRKDKSIINTTLISPPKSHWNVSKSLSTWNVGRWKNIILGQKFTPVTW